MFNTYLLVIAIAIGIPAAVVAEILRQINRGFFERQGKVRNLFLLIEPFVSAEVRLDQLFCIVLHLHDFCKTRLCDFVVHSFCDPRPLELVI